MNRRDFLDPRQLAQAAGQVLAAVEELHDPPLASAEDEVALLRVAHRAMATTFEVLLPYGTPDALAVAAESRAALERRSQWWPDLKARAS